MQEPSEATKTTTTIIPPIKVQDKGKGIMVEEPLKMKKKNQISFDKQEAQILQVEFDEEERLAREKIKANNAVIEQWHDIQAKVDADYELARRLQAKEQEQLTDAEKSRLFMEFLEKKKGNSLALKNKSFAEIKELFDKAMKRINNFADFRAELVEESTKKDKAKTVQERNKAKTVQERSSKRAGDELEQEIAKQRIEDEN
nr:hypothetical protein [Tanacetum cinerariifolium]